MDDPPPPSPAEFKMMPLREHLEELRRRLIYGLLGLIPTVLICLIYGRTLVVWMQMPLFGVQDYLGLPRGAFFFSPMAAFTVYVKVAVVSGVILAVPWIVYQLWKFLAEGLYPHERASVMLVAPVSALLMVLGVLFSFFVMVPICLLFLLGWSAGYPDPGQSDPVIRQVVTAAGRSGALPPPADGRRLKPTGNGQETDREPAEGIGQMTIPVLSEDPTAPAEGQIWLKMPEFELRIFAQGRISNLSTSRRTPFATLLGAKEMIGFTLMITIGVVVGFQLPLLMILLGRMGMVRAAWLARFRKYAALVCLLVSALLTPADPVSMVVLAGPLYLLFEIGLLLMKRFEPDVAAAPDSASEDRPSGRE